MSLLAAEGLTVRRGGREVLDEVSADFPGGRLVAVIGPNGAGKSTLLKVLAGVLRPDEGEVRLEGYPLGAFRASDLARRRAYLPQAPACDWPISVERLVALGLTPDLPMFGDLKEAQRRRVHSVLAQFDLALQRRQAATTLSGGELARAMLARALVGDPDLILLDEPTTGLDPRHALETALRLGALAGEGRLVIAALHDLTLVARHATHVLAMKGGRLVAHGPTAATLTGELVGELFGLEARVYGSGRDAVVDFPSAK